jgi:hypothetical protein
VFLAHIVIRYRKLEKFSFFEQLKKQPTFVDYFFKIVYFFIARYIASYFLASSKSNSVKPFACQDVIFNVTNL